MDQGFLLHMHLERSGKHDSLPCYGDNFLMLAGFKASIWKRIPKCCWMSLRHTNPSVWQVSVRCAIPIDLLIQGINQFGRVATTLQPVTGTVGQAGGFGVACPDGAVGAAGGLRWPVPVPGQDARASQACACLEHSPATGAAGSSPPEVVTLYGTALKG